MKLAFGWSRAGADFGQFPPTIPLVIIGALKAGGSGKTSVTLALAQVFSNRGLKVAILAYRIGKAQNDKSRSGRSSRVLGEVHPGEDWRKSSDEAVLLRQQSGCRVFVTRHRALAWKRLHSPEVYGDKPFDLILSDDGLEDPRLKGAMRIVLMAPGERPGLFDLLPAGPYRQTLAGCGSADLILEGPYAEGVADGDGGVESVQSVESAEKAEDGNPRMDKGELKSGVRRNLVHRFWRQVLLPSGMDMARPWIALCSLGNNGSFLQDLKQKAIVPVAVLEGANHTLISEQRMASVLLKHPNAGFLCTHKDFRKLEGQLDDRYFFKVVDQKIRLDDRVLAAVEAYCFENSQ